MRHQSPTHKHYFSTISKKLVSKNYLLWCQQVKPVIKPPELHHFLPNTDIPMKLTSIENVNHNPISPKFEAWEQQNQLLLAWLQS